MKMKIDITPGVVYVCDFIVSGDDKFTNYLGYIERQYAVKNSEGKMFYDMYADFYMDNKNKTRQSKEEASALFTARIDSLNQKQKDKIKNKFRLAQKRGSPLWRGVLSFDTKFLIRNGVFDANTGLVNADFLRKVTRNSMATLIKSEKMEATTWTASVHYNTDNIHIHTAMAETKPSRKKVTYKGKEEYRGKFKPSTLKKVKSSVANLIYDRREDLKRINELNREVFMKNMQLKTIKKEKYLRKKLYHILHEISKERILWIYNTSSMKKYHDLIDDFTDAYINHFHKDDYDEFIDLLEKQEKINYALYGKQKQGQYTQNKINEFYARMGNALLRVLREEQENIEKAEKSKNKIQIKNQYINLMNDLKKVLDKNYQSAKNQKEFEEMEKEISKNEEKSKLASLIYI